MRSYSLRELEAELQVTETITTDEIERDEPSLIGMFIHRDSTGQKIMWGPTRERYVHREVSTVAEADSVMFLCPACFEKNHGPVGTHSVLVTFAGRTVPPEAASRGKDGKSTRWNASGQNIDDLVLTPSIQIHASCNWHGFVGSNRIPPGRAG